MADSLELNSTQLKTVIHTLNSLIDPWLIILFGSYAKGRANEESDVDIAFLTEQKVEEYQVFSIAQKLADLLEKNVDCEDETRRKNYFLRAFKEYALLNEERAPILKRIKERGTIYGR